MDRLEEWRSIVAGREGPSKSIKRTPGQFHQDAISLFKEVKQVQEALDNRKMVGEEGKREPAVMFYSQINSLMSLLQSRLVQINSLIREEPAGWFTSREPSQQSIHQRNVVAFIEAILNDLSRRMERMREGEEGEERRMQKLMQRRLEMSKQMTIIKPHEEMVQLAPLDPRQVHMLERENAELKADLLSRQAVLSQTERDIMEIASLQSTLHSTLLQQADHIERLHEEAEETVDTVTRGNQILGKAGREQSGFTFFVIMMIMAIAILLLAIHFAFD